MSSLRKILRDGVFEQVTFLVLSRGKSTANRPSHHDQFVLLFKTVNGNTFYLRSGRPNSPWPY